MAIKKGDLVKIAAGATYYTGAKVPDWVRANTWVVDSVSGNRAVIDKSADGNQSICSPINTKFLVPVAAEGNVKQAVIACLEAIEKLPEFKALEALL